MKLRINEGAQNKPFILTTDELSKLLHISQEITLEGYYNLADGTIQNADYQRFKRKFPDANMLASIIPDGEWSVSILNADLLEGNSTKLQVVGADLRDLNVSIYSVSNSEASITENQIKSLIRIEDDTIKTSLLNVNKDNVATVVIRVQKSYDSSDFKDIVMSIRQVAITFTVEGINSEEIVEGKIPMFSLVDGEIAIFGKTKVFTEMWTGDYKIYDQDGSILSNARKYFSATSYEDFSVRIALSDESTRWSYEVSTSSNHLFPYVRGRDIPNKAARQELPFFCRNISGEDFTG